MSRRVTLVGGPMGQKEWGGPSLEPGDRIVVRKDPHGTAMRPVVYIVTEAEDRKRPGNLIAGYGGFATDEDLHR